MIFVEDQSIKVNGVILPGVVKSIEVKESAMIDEQQVEGSAAKPKQATGYEDARINIELIIDDTPTQTKYQRFAVARAIFRKPGQSVPQPIPISSEDTAAHGIERVLFKSISHKAENKKGLLPVSLEFWEYVPQTIKTTKKDSSGASSSSSANSASSSVSTDSATTALTADYSAYLDGSRGTAPKIGSSPAIDDASPVAGLNRVTQMPY